MALTNIQNATGRRSGWTGGGTGGVSSVANVGAGAGVWRDTVAGVANLKSLVAGAGVNITVGADDLTIKLAPGTDYNFPFWLTGALSVTSPLTVNGAKTELSFLGTSYSTFSIKSVAAGNIASLWLTCVGDATQAGFYFVPAGILGSTTYLTAPDQLNVEFGANGLYLTSMALGYQFKVLSGLVTLRQIGGANCNFTVQSDLAGRYVNFRLRNAAAGMEALFQFTPVGGILDVASEIIHITANNDVFLASTVNTSSLTLNSNGLTFERSGASGAALRVIATTTLTDTTILLVNSADAKTVSIRGASGYLLLNLPHDYSLAASSHYETIPVTFGVTAGTSYFQTYTNLNLVLNTTGLYYAIGLLQRFLVNSVGDSIFGGGAAVDAAARVTVRAPTGAGIQNSIHLTTTDAATVGNCRISADNSAKYAALTTWGSGVGAGYAFGGVAALNAGGLVGFDISTLVMYTLATGAGYIPLAWGQSASGGDREVAGIDSTGNFWFAYTSPVLFGKTGVTGSRRISKPTAAGEIDFEQYNGAAWVSDIATFQALSSGTVYTINGTYQLATFGTTSPDLTITRPGTYLIVIQSVVKFNSPMWAAAGNINLKLRRINNTAADLAEQAYSYQAEDYPTAIFIEGALVRQLIYTTANSDDNIQLWAQRSTAPSSGSVTMLAGHITAVRLR